MMDIHTDDYTPFTDPKAVLEEAEWLAGQEHVPYRIEWCGDHFIAIADHLPTRGHVLGIVGRRG